MINRITSTLPQDNNQIAKELAKKIETLFLTELLKVMFADTSFGKDTTTSTYLTVAIPEIASMMAERDIGIGKFLTENPNFMASLQKSQKIELKTPAQIELQKTEQKPQPNLLPERISLPVPGRITSSYGLRIDPIDGKIRHHNGIDIAVPKGTEIKAVMPGKVVYSGYSRGYGNCVIIEHENGIQTVYAHNSKNLVKTGQTVTKDTVIALSGDSGRTTGPHLHFEVRKNGNPVNPLAMINKSEKTTIL